MRVLICNFEYPPLGGGGGASCAWLAAELAKRHEVTVLTSRAFGLAARTMECGVTVVRVRTSFRRHHAVANVPSMLTFMALGVGWGRKLLAAEQYDVVNTHFALPTGPVGDRLAREANIPNVLSLHGGDVYDPSKLTSPHRHPVLRGWIRRLLRRADLVVANSSNTLENMRRFYLPEVSAALIPLAIPRPPAVAVGRGSFGFGSDEILLVTVGRLVARKAVGQLISLVEKLRRHRAHLLIIGTGPEERRLKDTAAARGVADSVHFFGHVGELDKFRLLRMSDIYVSTSQHEGFGLVFLEAMASGLPVLCYGHGGQVDFLLDGQTGYLVPLNDLTAFTERCRELIGNPDLRRTIGEHNRERAESFYIETYARRYEGVFRDAIGTRAASVARAPAATLSV
jgi:glycosyltransferase involved in cell wall biosynthesis